MGRVLSTYQVTYATNANNQCAVVCNTGAYNFFGIVNTNITTAGVDCYCGNTLKYVTVLGLGTGIAPDNNCATCIGGPAPAGDCGIQTSSTVAIYARAF